MLLSFVMKQRLNLSPPCALIRYVTRLQERFFLSKIKNPKSFYSFSYKSLPLPNSTSCLIKLIHSNHLPIYGQYFIYQKIHDIYIKILHSLTSFFTIFFRTSSPSFVLLMQMDIEAKSALSCFQ